MPGYSIQPYAVQPAATMRPQARPILPARQPQNLAAAPARGQQPPRVRMQNEATAPLRTALRMPSPEELGLTPTPSRTDEVDWVRVRNRVQALSLTSFHMQKLPEGGYRFVCIVPTNAGDRRVEAESLTEADAIDRALTQAESLR